MRARMLVLASLVAVGAHADNTLTVPNVISTVDVQAAPDQLTTLFTNTQMALTALTPYAINVNDTYSVGLQLGAIHTLATYCATACTTDAYTTLTQIIDTPTYSTAQSGPNLLVLRAALESLAELPEQPVTATDHELATIESYLAHPSRDIRTSAARTLRALGDPCAISQLRLRYQQEPTDQVRFAISDALSYLSTLPMPPTCSL